MRFCPQCGSTSRDKDGFCGGCRAPWFSAEPATKPASQPTPYEKLPATIASMGIDAARPKLVWYAVVASLLFGPLGLAYSTIAGAVVMTIASIALELWIGAWSLLIVVPVCAIW